MIAFYKESELMNINKSTTLCFSGHRPEKLFDGIGLDSEAVRRVLSVLQLAINEAVAEGYDTFITGMARGIDMWAASLVMEMKRTNPDLKIICAIPFRGQGDSLTGEEKLIYLAIKSVAEEIIYISEEYSSDCMRKRNQFMVDNSSKLIAVVSNYRSGTGQTIRYAKKCGIETRVIDIMENLPMFLA